MQLSTSEAIQQIQEVYHQQYAPDSYFDAFDQLLISQTLEESSPVIPTYSPDNEESRIIDNTSVYRCVNDSYKRSANFELTQSKIDIISQLENCTSRTSPLEIAKLLEAFFYEYHSKPYWWPYVARHWSPRPIYRVIHLVIKQQAAGWVTVQNPAKLFTFLIKRRKPRKTSTNTNGGCKHHTL